MTLLPIVIAVSEEQPRKASLSIEVTLLGISMDVSPEQSLKAEFPIEVTLLPIVMDVNVFFPKKGEPLIFRPICPVSSGQLSKTDSRQYKSCSPSSKIREYSREHPRKAYLSIEVTLLGIVMEVSEEQPRKAS